MGNVNITAEEYKRLLLDSKLQTEREQLRQATNDYIQRRDEVGECLKNRFKSTEERYQSRIDELLTKIKRYESNWFVKAFLKSDKDNNKLN